MTGRHGLEAWVGGEGKVHRGQRCSEEALGWIRGREERRRWDTGGREAKQRDKEDMG